MSTLRLVAPRMFVIMLLLCIGLHADKVSAESENIYKITLFATEDARVESRDPDRNFGSEGTEGLHVKGNLVDFRDSMLRFDVGNKITELGDVTKATLRLFYLYPNQHVPEGWTLVYKMDETNIWSENNVTWHTKPDYGNEVASHYNPEVSGTWIEFDVTDAITADGLQAFYLKATSWNNDVYFHARESAVNPPELVLEWAPLKSSYPEDGAVNVATSTEEIKLEFRSAMKEATLNSNNIKLMNVRTQQPVPYTAFNTVGNEYTMLLLEELAYDETYKVMVTADVKYANEQSIGTELAILFTTQAETNEGSSKQIKLHPTEDARVESRAPKQNFGTDGAGGLHVKGNQVDFRDSMLKFSITGIEEHDTGVTAKLRLYYTYPGQTIPEGHTTVHQMNSSSSWGESSVTWRNKPAHGHALSTTANPATSGQWMEFDVTDAVTQNGPISLYLKATSWNNDVYFHAREANEYQPELILNWPIVSGSVPTDGAEGVSIRTNEISLSFLKEMDQSTLTSSNITVVNEAGRSLRISEVVTDATHISLRLAELLEHDHNYAIKINRNVRYEAGGQIEQEVIRKFKTLPEVENFQTTTRYKPWLTNLHLTTPEMARQGDKGGEGAQLITSLAIAKSNPNFLLMALDTYTVWRSENGSKDWSFSDLNSQINSTGFVSVAIDPEDENLVFGSASAHEGLLVTEGSGIYRSTDGGRNWEHVLHGSYYSDLPDGFLVRSSPDIIQFGEITATGRTVYVGFHHEGVFKSIDSGTTWEHIGFEDTIITELYYDRTNSRLFVATYDDGLFISNDQGATWQLKTGQLPTNNIRSIAVKPNDANTWLVVAGASSMYLSENAGSNWRKLNGPQGLPSSGTYKRAMFSAPDSAGNSRIYLSLHAMRYPLRVSNDMGATWSNEPELQMNNVFYQSERGWEAEAVLPHPTDPNIVWASFRAQLFKSTDGGQSFKIANSGYSGARARDFLFHPNDDLDIIIAHTDIGLAKSVDPGTTLYPMFYELTVDDSNNIRNPVYSNAKTVSGIVRDPNNEEHIFISTGNFSHSSIAESWDNGKSFRLITETGGNLLTYMAYHPQQQNIIYADDRVSTDNGKTWSFLTRDIQAVSPFNGDIVYSANTIYTQQETDNQGKPINRVYKSTDRGATWSVISELPYAPNPDKIMIREIMADRFVQDRLWIATNNGIYRLDDTELTYFGEANGLLPHPYGDIEIFSIDQNPHNANHLVAGGSDYEGFAQGAGPFETYDGGITWQRVPGLPGKADIWKVKFHPNAAQVYMATSAGTWVYEFDRLLAVMDVTSNENIIGDQTWSDYAVEASFKVSSWSIDAELGLYARYNNPNNTYQLLYDSEEQKAKIIKRTNGVEVTLAESAVLGLAANEAHLFRFTVEGDTLTGCINSNCLVTATDDDLSSGKAGVFAKRQTVEISDVVVFDEVLFMDNFETRALTGWTEHQGQWTSVQEDGKFLYKASATNLNETINGSRAWEDYQLAMTFKVEDWQVDGMIGVYARYIDYANFYKVEYYHQNNILRIMKRVNGVDQELARTTISPLAKEQYYQLRFKVIGNQLQLQVNNSNQLSVSDGSLSKGAIGLVSENQPVVIDTVRVTPQ